ncbi:MAG: hypothetical protein H8M99_01705 [Gloeobacteraceae cyanobacterium ES-bin-144]|nr:hypothetical protein [Verrucomicrobiales bacterium]
MKCIISLAAALLLVAYAGTNQALSVKQFLLRDEERHDSDQPYARMEKETHLRGAVSMAERRQRLGQYFTARWNDSAGVNQAPVTILFQYQQGATASRVKHMTKEFPASAAGGAAEFAVIGDDFFVGGRVLAWKVTASRGKRELASQQSYLWQ